MTLLGTSNRSMGSLGFLPQIPPLPRLGIRGLPAQSFRNGSREPIFLGRGESGDGAPASCGAARSWSGCGVFRHSSTASSTGSSRHSKTPSTSTRLSAGWLPCLAILDRRRYSAPAVKLAALGGRGMQGASGPWRGRPEPPGGRLRQFGEVDWSLPISRIWEYGRNCAYAANQQTDRLVDVDVEGVLECRDGPVELARRAARFGPRAREGGESG